MVHFDRYLLGRRKSSRKFGLGCKENLKFSARKCLKTLFLKYKNRTFMGAKREHLSKILQLLSLVRSQIVYDLL